MTAGNPEDHRPLPVILASSPVKALWPHSSPERPWHFRRHGGELSAVERLLADFAADDRFGPAMIVVPQSAVGVAREQVADWRHFGVRMLVVPDELGADACATLAALDVDAPGHGRMLAFVPATVRHAAGQPLADVLHQGIGELAGNECALFYVRRAGARAAGFAFEPGAPDLETGLRTAEAVRVLRNDDESQTALGAESLLVPAGPVVCSTGLLLQTVRNSFPALVNSASSALKLADRWGHTTCPHPGFLSLIPAGPTVAEMMHFQPANVLLHNGGANMNNIQSWADLDSSPRAERSPPIVGTAGIGPHRVIHGPHGVFVCAEGYEEAAAVWYGTGADQEHSPPPGVRMREWGTEQLVEEEYGIRVLRLEIAVGKALPSECHFKRQETWAISSGLATVTIDEQIRTARGGDLLVIPPGAFHALRNTGKEPLIFFECRIGSLLGDEDRIVAEQASIQSESADWHGPTAAMS